MLIDFVKDLFLNGFIKMCEIGKDKIKNMLSERKLIIQCLENYIDRYNETVIKNQKIKRKVRKCINEIIHNKDFKNNYLYFIENNEFKSNEIIKQYYFGYDFKQVISFDEFMDIFIYFIEKNENFINNNILKLSANYTENKTKFETIIYNYKIYKNKSSVGKFHYMNENMNELYGRNNEIKILKQFLDDNSPFLFSVICGPGGSGKSKLAYSFISSLNSNEWKGLFYSGKELDNLIECKKINFNKNILLVIDYAGFCCSNLNCLINNIIDYYNSDHCKQHNSKNKLRLILLEREGMNVSNEEQFDGSLKLIDIFPEWYNTLIGYMQLENRNFNINDFLFNGSFIKIGGFKHTQDYIDLINKYSEVNYNCQLKNPKNIVEVCRNKFGKNPLPIYVLFLTDAYHNHKKIAEMNIDETLNYIYKRNIIIWKKKITNNEVYVALKEILVYATIFNGWKAETCPLDYLKEYINTVEKYCLLNDNSSLTYTISILSGYVIQDDGKIIMTGLEPDLIGEFFVAKQFALWSNNMKVQKCKEIGLKFKSAYNFFYRGLQDYPQGIFPIIRVITKITLDKKVYNEDNMYTLLKLLYYYLKYNNDERCSVIYKLIIKLENEFRFKDISTDEMFVLIFSLDKSNNLINKYKMIYDYCYKYPNSEIIFKSYVDFNDQVKDYLIYHNYNITFVIIANNFYDFIFGLKNERLAILYILEERKYLRKIINIRNNRYIWNFYLELLINKYIRILYRWKDTDWYSLKWQIPAILYPIISSLSLKTKSNSDKKILIKLFELYNDYFEVIINDENCDKFIVYHYKLQLGDLPPNIYDIPEILKIINKMRLMKDKR